MLDNRSLNPVCWNLAHMDLLGAAVCDLRWVLLAWLWQTDQKSPQLKCHRELHPEEIYVSVSNSLR